MMISVRNLTLQGFHGVMPEERSLGQKFYIDLDCSVPDKEERQDDLEDTVCYAKLCETAETLSQSKTFQLIETLADKLADAVLLEHPLVQHVAVSIRKPSAPMRFNVDHVGVSLKKSRSTSC